MQILRPRACIAAALLLAGGHAAAATSCPSAYDGLYVTDQNSAALKDGGRFERVRRALDDEPTDFSGTTGQFGYAIWIRNGQARIYASIGNLLNEEYETLYITEPMTTAIGCDGSFRFSYQTSQYYTDFIRLGGLPREKPRKIRPQYKVDLSGTLARDGLMLIRQCAAYQKEGAAWRALGPHEGMIYSCPDVDMRKRLFNIAPYTVGKAGWAPLK